MSATVRDPEQVQRKQNGDVARRVFIGLAVVGLLTVLPKVIGYNDGTRMATIQALIDLHSLSIDETAFRDINDKVFLGGRFYSDKLAGPSLLGSIVYWPLSMLGFKLGYGWNVAYYLITLCTVKASWLAGSVAFYKSLGFTPLTERGRIWLTLALGVGSLYFTWSATFNNHSLAASWVAIGFHFMLRARHAQHVRVSLFLSGFFFALVGSSDVPVLIVFVGYFLYLLTNKELRRDVTWFLLPLPLAALPALLVNYRISGSFVPVQLVPEYFQWPGSPWLPEMLTGAEMNTGSFLLEYAFHALIGKHGFLIYNPLLLLAIPFLIRELNPKRSFFGEACVTCVVAVPLVGYYLLYSNNYGGNSYSIRWFVPLLPLLFFFLHPVLEGAGRLTAVFFVLFTAGVVLAVIGLVNPWSSMRLSEYPVMANLETVPILLAEARKALFG